MYSIQQTTEKSYICNDPPTRRTSMLSNYLLFNAPKNIILITANFLKWCQQFQVPTRFILHHINRVPYYMLVCNNFLNYTYFLSLLLSFPLYSQMLIKNAKSNNALLTNHSKSIKNSCIL